MTIGDFATTRVDGTFTLAYLVFNTIMNLTSQDEQVACFGNVAAHLEPGGCFVIEVGVPAAAAATAGRDHPGRSRSRRRGSASTSTTSPGQGLVSHHYRVVDGSVGLLSMPFRYVWPAELDLMARLAGMTIARAVERLAREPFTSDSTSHVSVWEKPAATGN